MNERRLKHWGWGYEDQVPSKEELGQAAAGIRERFGFGGKVEEPVPLDAVDLRKPRLKVPSAFGELFRDDHYQRVSHALGKAYRDVVRGFRGVGWRRGPGGTSRRSTRTSTTWSSRCGRSRRGGPGR